MKLAVFGSVLFVVQSRIGKRENESVGIEVNEDEDPNAGPIVEEYDIDEYDDDSFYDDYESSGDGFWEFAKNKFADLFHHRHEDTDYYDGSGHVQDWWDNWAEHDYEEEEYSESDLPQMVTAYPIPKLNEHGHVDMAELAFRDTLDEYFDIFVIILSGSILLLLAWAGYSRVRNIRYLKREYGQEKELEESKGLLNQ